MSTLISIITEPTASIHITLFILIRTGDITGKRIETVAGSGWHQNTAVGKNGHLFQVHGKPCGLGRNHLSRRARIVDGFLCR